LAAEWKARTLCQNRKRYGTLEEQLGRDDDLVWEHRLRLRFDQPPVIVVDGDKQIPCIARRLL
jgi:hypothetical protein